MLKSWQSLSIGDSRTGAFGLCTSSLYKFFSAKKITCATGDCENAKPKSCTNRKTAKPKVSKESSRKMCKEQWLASLSIENKDGEPTCKTSEAEMELMVAGTCEISKEITATQNSVVIGVDPDLKGAIAVLRIDNQNIIPEVYDVPTVKVYVGKARRCRPDVCALLNLLRSLNVPQGTIAFIEQSMPYPTDGKQGWWSSGFGYGIWIGSLMGCGISVIPVPARTWKSEMGFTAKDRVASKDEARVIASNLFTCMAPKLRRKKDHGRADALLIAAYGKCIQSQTI